MIGDVVDDADYEDFINCKSMCFVFCSSVCLPVVDEGGGL